MNPTPDIPENPLKQVTDGVSNLLQQVSAISAADFKLENALTAFDRCRPRGCEQRCYCAIEASSRYQ